MKTFQTYEVRDFAETFIDESTVHSVICWVRDNVSPEDVFDESELVNWARGFANTNPDANAMSTLGDAVDYFKNLNVDGVESGPIDELISAYETLSM